MKLRLETTGRGASIESEYIERGVHVFIFKFQYDQGQFCIIVQNNLTRCYAVYQQIQWIIQY